jgi:hypothetical protein
VAIDELSLDLRFGSAKQECEGLHKARCPEHDQQGVARQLLPRRNPPELTHDEFEIALDRSEVGASLAALRLDCPLL